MQDRRIESKFSGLEGKKVAVVCLDAHTLRQPGGEADAMARALAKELAANVKDIKLISESKVADWMDNQRDDVVDFRDVAKGVKADMVVGIDLKAFRIHEPGGTTLRGRATVEAVDLSAARPRPHDYENAGHLPGTYSPRHRGAWISAKSSSSKSPTGWPGLLRLRQDLDFNSDRNTSIRLELVSRGVAEPSQTFSINGWRRRACSPRRRFVRMDKQSPLLLSEPLYWSGLEETRFPRPKIFWNFGPDLRAECDFNDRGMLSIVGNCEEAGHVVGGVGR
jgi:hypothetical protein